MTDGDDARETPATADRPSFDGVLLVKGTGPHTPVRADGGEQCEACGRPLEREVITAGRMVDYGRLRCSSAWCRFLRWLGVRESTD